jgi:hypothetical protein
MPHARLAAVVVMVVPADSWDCRVERQALDRTMEKPRVGSSALGGRPQRHAHTGARLGREIKARAVFQDRDRAIDVMVTSTMRMALILKRISAATEKPEA